MKLDCVTSLADLAFRAKSNKYYQRLIILAYRWYIKEPNYNIEWYEALTLINLKSICVNPLSCKEFVRGINSLRGHVENEPYFFQ